MRPLVAPDQSEPVVVVLAHEGGVRVLVEVADTLGQPHELPAVEAERASRLGALREVEHPVAVG